MVKSKWNYGDLNNAVREGRMMTDAERSRELNPGRTEAASTENRRPTVESHPIAGDVLGYPGEKTIL